MSRGILQDFIQDPSGNAVVGASVEVFIADGLYTTQAALWDAAVDGNSVANPITTVGRGYFSAYADTAEYDLRVTTSGGTFDIPNVPVFDADELTDLAGSVSTAVSAAAEAEASAAASAASAAESAASAIEAAEIVVDTLRTVATLAELVALSPADGVVVETKGYNSAGDGGGNRYLAKKAANDAARPAEIQGYIIHLNGLPTEGWYFEAQFKGSVAYGEQLGATNSDVAFIYPLQAFVDASGIKELQLTNDIWDCGAFSPPNGFRLIGKNRPDFDKDLSTWGSGSLLADYIDLATTRGFYGCDFGIDVYTAGDNAVVGTSVACRENLLERVTTRANNHGWLFEQNHSAPDKIDGGYNIAVDCLHYGGPNGFVSKMPNTWFIRCKTFDCTVQDFVAVSDNINGNTTYSRAYNVHFVDCEGEGGKTRFRVYSRDHFNPGQIEAIYSGAVIPAENVFWGGGAISGCTEHGAIIGDFYEATPTIFRLKSKNVVISNRTRITDNGFAGVNVLCGDGIDTNGNIWGGNGADAGYPAGTNVVYDGFGERVVNIRLGDESNIYLDQATGIESGISPIPLNTGTITVQHNAQIYKTANTATTIISAALNAQANQSIKIWLDDEFTTCVLGGITVTGKGSVAEYYWSDADSDWVLVAHDLVAEIPMGYTDPIAVVFGELGVSSKSLALGGNAASMTFSDAGTSQAGRSFLLRVRSADAFGKALPSFPSNVKFSTQNPTVTTINAGEETVYDFYWTGAVYVIKSINTYTI